VLGRHLATDITTWSFEVFSSGPESTVTPSFGTP
jgi:hypothetical protein